MRDLSAVGAVFRLEIRTLVRDPRTLLISVVLPVVLIPALLVGGAWLDGQRAEREEVRVYRLAITGADSAFAAGLLAEVLGDAPGSRFRPVPADAPREALDSDSIDLYLEAFTPESWTSLDEEEIGGVDLAAEFDDARVLRIRFHSTRTASREGAERLREHLEAAREARRDSILLESGFPVAPERVAEVETISIATDEAVAGARLGEVLSLLLVGLMLLGGSVVATDTLAGEKERGTLMTLLTSAASRTEIVTGKLLAIMAVALGIALVQVLNLWIFLGLGLIDPGMGLAVTVSPVLALGLILLYLPVVALVAGILLLASAHANSYKEAQLYLTPVLLGMAVPALAPMLPDISLQSAILAVPIANISVAARDLLVGQVHLPAFAVAWLVTAGAAAWVTGRSVRALHDEGVITGDTSREEFVGGPALFPKRVLRWFLVFWAVSLLIEMNLPIEDLRLGILVNVGLVFGLFSLVVIRWFRLDPREALALRMPRPGVWGGVLLGVPAAFVVAMGLFQVMDLVLPVPTELLESFGQGFEQEGLPLWQLLLLISLVPAVAEELTFRGVLLHGLRTRLGPVGLALAVGLIFGFFHFQIFRIPTTAFLGVLFTAVTLLTGSIFPAMLWHALNNALATYLGSLEVDVEALGWEVSLAGVALLLVSFWIIWRFRTPYPGVRKAGMRPRPGPDGPAGTGA